MYIRLFTLLSSQSVTVSTVESHLDTYFKKTSNPTTVLFSQSSWAKGAGVRSYFWAPLSVWAATWSQGHQGLTDLAVLVDKIALIFTLLIPEKKTPASMGKGNVQGTFLAPFLIFSWLSVYAISSIRLKHSFSYFLRRNSNYSATLVPGGWGGGFYCFLISL